MIYRVNYGDGTVSRTFYTKSDAFKERAALEDPGPSYIEFSVPTEKAAFSEARAWYPLGNVPLPVPA